ncbi:hypothetical protein [Zunongwangia sp. H14]|uniref:hypothetical protein n=1 Tax=Zunongwangia sp. H14 TaxID=3240792 RepID=UPI003561431A
MSLILKLFLILLPLSMFTSFAQEQENIYTAPHAGKLQIEVGIHQNFALGKNFLGDAYNLNTGLEYGLDVFVDPNWLVGFKIDHVGGEVEKPEKLGNVKSTIINTVALNGGYSCQVNPRIDLSLFAAFGYASYVNTSFFDTKFHDNAFVFWLQPKIGYRITKNMGIFGAGKWRKDFTSIKTSPELEKYFGSATIASLSLGIRITTN